MKRTASRSIRSACLGVLVLLAGCDTLFGSLTGAYRGPRPSETDIAGETVVVRTVDTQPATGIRFYHVDRVRFLDAGDPHHVDRVVEVHSRDVQPAVERLALKVGDRVRISTRYVETRLVGGLGDRVPDWPGHGYDEYPIGFHALTSVERAQ
ncbi:MAG TPA: hypothetical protein VF263_16165 [Longimicrobiaceae bacterium]